MTAPRVRVRTQPPPHGHVNRYRVDGCRCAACDRAQRLDRSRAEQERLRGTPRYVDAAPVREHVERLRAAGLSNAQVAAQTGEVVNRTSVRVLLVGQAGRPPSRRLQRHVAAALLAVRALPTAIPPTGSGWLDATGVRRRLQALLVYGYPPSWIADQLGVTRANVQHLWNPEHARVTAETARKVAALYGRVESFPGPRPDLGARYAARGWLQPGWWDACTIDDPSHVPDTRTEDERDRDERRALRQDRRDRTAELVERGVLGQQLVDQLRSERLLPAGLDEVSARRQVERDKAWWRSRGRALQVAG